MYDTPPYTNKNRDRAQRILNDTAWRDLGYESTTALLNKAVVHALLGLIRAVEYSEIGVGDE